MVTFTVRIYIYIYIYKTENIEICTSSSFVWNSGGRVVVCVDEDHTYQPLHSGRI